MDGLHKWRWLQVALAVCCGLPGMCPNEVWALTRAVLVCSAYISTWRSLCMPILQGCAYCMRAMKKGKRQWGDITANIRPLLFS